MHQISHGSAELNFKTQDGWKGLFAPIVSCLTLHDGVDSSRKGSMIDTQTIRGRSLSSTATKLSSNNFDKDAVTSYSDGAYHSFSGRWVVSNGYVHNPVSMVFALNLFATMLRACPIHSVGSLLIPYVIPYESIVV